MEGVVEWGALFSQAVGFVIDEAYIKVSSMVCWFFNILVHGLAIFFLALLNITVGDDEVDDVQFCSIMGSIEHARYYQ